MRGSEGIASGVSAPADDSPGLRLHAILTSLRIETMAGRVCATAASIFQFRNWDTGALQMKPNAVLQPAAVSDPSDEELMVRLQGHDTSALNTLFSRYSRVVFGIAFRVLHDVGESEEVVQESFLYLYQKVKLFDPSRGGAKIWIVQIAYSRAKDRKAHLSRRGFYLRSDIESLELDETLAAGFAPTQS